MRPRGCQALHQCSAARGHLAGPATPKSAGRLVKGRCLGPGPDGQNQSLWGWGLEICILNQEVPLYPRPALLCSLKSEPQGGWRWNSPGSSNTGSKPSPAPPSLGGWVPASGLVSAGQGGVLGLASPLLQKLILRGGRHQARVPWRAARAATTSRNAGPCPPPPPPQSLRGRDPHPLSAPNLTQHSAWCTVGRVSLFEVN